MIFIFENDQAKKAVLSGKKVFSKKEYSKEVLEEIKAWNDAHKGRPGFKFVD